MDVCGADASGRTPRLVNKVPRRGCSRPGHDSGPRRSKCANGTAATPTSWD
jgi:hypothetical protein